jgi:formylglycine-generating enzyme required for sulfatase activity
VINFAGGIQQVATRVKICIDNGPAPRSSVAAISAGSRLVTNGKFLNSCEAAVIKPELWLSDGWGVATGWNSPLYWEPSNDNGPWLELSFAGMHELDLSASLCHVSYYEADAFARWSGARLPREEEWEVAAAQVPESPKGALQEDRAFHPQPARGTGMQHGLQQMVGDVWEWTASWYVGYPGFRPARPGGRIQREIHVQPARLRGGSCATPASIFAPPTGTSFLPSPLAIHGIRLAR